jgi:Domain of unknown function (DUF5679)/TIR domain
VKSPFAQNGHFCFMIVSRKTYWEFVMPDEFYDDDEFELEVDEAEPIEGYCVSCKQTVEIEDPQAVYTSKGLPATRGECPDCGTTVFRMGRTYLHASTTAPKAVQVIPNSAKGRNTKATYIAAAVTDAEFAEKLAHDLKQIGIHVWVDDSEEVDTTKWSGGVHPALSQCTHLVVVLSSFAAPTTSVKDAWTYFLKNRKPVVVAQIEAVDPPDELRSRPRYDFMGEYKSAFRGLVEALSR